MYKTLLTPRWIITSILVMIAMIVMIRLGIWQLDRLKQRKDFNSRVSAQVNQPILDLNNDVPSEKLMGMEFRKVKVFGEYNFSQEIALRNQYWQNQWGVHLVTPLHINGHEKTILIDRGWIPANDFQSMEWSKFNEPGLVEIEGIIRNSQTKADYGNRSDEVSDIEDNHLDAWNFVNIPQISRQTSNDLLPVYIQQAPDQSWRNLPYRTQPELDLTDGPHLGYAIQWFSFAAILGIGYPIFIRRQLNQSKATPNDQINTHKNI
ncbi:SURF1 family protein [Chloroflexota bacterium]